MFWRIESKKIESKGSTAKKARNLGDLHRRRAESEGQFFTPEWVSRGIWQSLSGITSYIRDYDSLDSFSVFDNSIGSGRLLEGMPTDIARIYGADTDHRVIDALANDAAKAELNYEFTHSGMEDLEVGGFDISVINPAYSIHLESPNLTPYKCNSFGRYGQAKAALSHEYALEQALDAAQIVAAVLPISMDDYCRKIKRLSMVVKLPKNTFWAEGANVETAVYFFSRKGSEVQEYFVSDVDFNWPKLDINPVLQAFGRRVKFKVNGIDVAEPVITLPVTRNSTVEMHHHNRRIVLKYHCGLTMAKVENGLRSAFAQGDRLPRSIKYSGDGQFLLDVLLLQDSPDSQLEAFADRINSLGGKAVISPTLAGYYSKLVKRHKRAITPMRRVVLNSGVSAMVASAKKRTLLQPGDFSSPAVKKGQSVVVYPNGGEFDLTLNGVTATLRKDEFFKRYDVDSETFDSNAGEWVVLHKGLCHHFPALARQYEARIEAAGIGHWLESFQKESLIEGLISPYGYIGAWEQGSGKARYAIALALLHSGTNIIALESGLLPEMRRELIKIGFDEKLFKILGPGDMPTAKVNITSYATLRGDAKLPGKNITNAQRWRRMANAVICDEGGLLANIHTQQSQAVRALAARKLIVLDGTPQRNYPRDLLPLTSVSAGHGVAHQRHGVKGKPSIAAHHINSVSYIQRGEDAFYDDHVVTQWVTNEFKEDLQSGGKREVPKINNLGLFREWLNPNIQRRLRNEPDLAVFKRCPDPERSIKGVGWDEEHLGHYLKTATEFAQWYKNQRGNTRAANLVTVLARVGAVQRAANSPHVESKSAMTQYMPITSKQRFAIERIKYWKNKGRKVILYAKSPDVLARIHGELAKEGIKSVLFTGKVDINKRAKALDDEFRYGDSDVLLSSWVGQRGLNLEQAGAAIFYERDWSATTEEQAIFRTQRPEQTQTVQVEYLHLFGSIDEYCAQLVDWKKKAAAAGLDYGEQAGEDEEFLHLDTILTRFCEEVLSMSPYKAKELLAA